MKAVWVSGLVSLLAVFALSGIGTAVARQNGWNGNDAAWFSAFATSLAIVAAIFAVRLQLLAQAQTERQRRVELALVAYDLASEALELVTNRLDVALSPKQPESTYALREHRTTETILAMRELEPHALPPNMLEEFVQVRSCVYAINQRISEVYADSNGDPAFEIYKNLSGAVNVHGIAIKAFARLGNAVEGELGGRLMTRRLIPVPIAITAFPGNPVLSQRNPRKGGGAAAPRRKTGH